MGFEQATIKVEKEAEFAELKGAISRGLAPERAARFLKQLRSNDLRVRDWDALLDKKILERIDDVLAKSGKTAKSLYGELTLSDQALMREFYLSQLEEIGPELRTKFSKLYRYY